jgi:hypothetical protein
VNLVEPMPRRPNDWMLTSTGAPRSRVRAHHQAGGRDVR